jgi:uncharacterized membrane protein YkoI
MKRWMWLAATALATTVAIPMASTAQADEKHETPTSMDKIPAAARDALTKEAGGAPITDVEQKTENGKTVYEGHVRKGTEVVGIEVDESGKVLKKEVEGKGGETKHK